VTPENGVNSLYRRVTWALAGLLVAVIGGVIAWAQTGHEDHEVRIRHVEQGQVRIEATLQAMQDTARADHRAILRAIKGGP